MFVLVSLLLAAKSVAHTEAADAGTPLSLAETALQCPPDEAPTLHLLQRNAQWQGVKNNRGIESKKRRKAKKGTGKMGLHFNGAYGQSELLEQVGALGGDLPPGAFSDMATDYATWVDMLNFGTVDENLAAWANKHQKEVVLMLKSDTVGSEDQGSPYRCTMGHHKASKACTKEKVIEILSATIQQLDVAPQYLFGYNEPYALGPKEKDADPSVQAGYWAEFLIPAAQNLSLKLISPTADHKLMKTSDPTQFGGLGWFIEFVKQCYYLRDATPPCDVGAISAISIHILSDNVGCSYDMVHEHYAEGGHFQSEFVAHMESNDTVAVPGEPDFWRKWIEERPFWVHALNCCGSTSEWSSHADQCICERLSGGTYTDGPGAVRALEELETVQRWQLVNTPFYIKTGCPAMAAGTGNCSKEVAPELDMAGPLGLSGLGRAVLDIVSGQDSDPSACPLPNPESKWVVGELEQACDEACEGVGLLTTQAAMRANAVSGANLASLVAEASDGSLRCNAVTESSSKKAPFFVPDATTPTRGECFHRPEVGDGDVAEQDFALKKGVSNGRRLCYCFYTTSDAEF